MKQNNSASFQLKIKHRNWLEAIEEAFSLLVTVSPGEMINIVGPSRVGKTKLIDELRKLLDQGNDFNETGLLISIGVRAVNAGPKGAFSTKDFIYRMLEEVKHPMYSSFGENGGDELKYSKLDAIPERTLRSALERGIISRGVRYIFVDEAQHVKYTTTGAMAPSAVMDSWKCLAEDTNTILVVVGAYPILNTMLNSPHLLGRKYQVHMPRYYRTKGDLEQFRSIVKAFESRMTIDEIIGSMHKNEKIIALLYEGSLGCIGLLRAWLLHAHAVAQVKKSPVTESILLKTKKSIAEFDVIAREIEDGEEMLRQIEGSDQVAPEKESMKVKKKSSGKPFQRKPKRMSPGHRSGR